MKEKNKEKIIAIGSILISIIMFLLCVQLAFVQQPTKKNDSLPDNSEYVTHGIYKTVDGGYVTIVNTENGRELMSVSENEFYMMMKYDVDFLTAKEMMK